MFQFFRRSTIICGTLLIFARFALAAVDRVPRSVEELQPDSWTRTQNVRVVSAQVVAVDYDLILKDFPHLIQRPYEDMATWKLRVDEWILRETAFIGIEQSRQSVVNSEISLGTGLKEAYRPPDYGRAFVLPVEGGFMDAKGVGSLTPQQRHHGNGLATLGEVIREFVFEKLVDRVFRHSGTNVRTVGNYAAVDYGFDVIHGDGSRDRAGYVLRQAHRRAPGRISLLEESRLVEIESVLRRYGLTSSGETMNGGSGWDYINIQGTDNVKISEILDFGAFFVNDEFIRETVSPWTRKVLWKPGDSLFPQPDESLRVPLDQWGDFGNHDPKADKPWIWAHETAKAIAEGRADRTAVQNYLDNLLGPFEEKLNLPKTNCRAVY